MNFRKPSARDVQVLHGETFIDFIRNAEGIDMAVVRLELKIAPLSRAGGVSALRPLHLHTQACRSMAAQLLKAADMADAELRSPDRSAH